MYKRNVQTGCIGYIHSSNTDDIIEFYFGLAQILIPGYAHCIFTQLQPQMKHVHSHLFGPGMSHKPFSIHCSHRASVIRMSKSIKAINRTHVS